MRLALVTETFPPEVNGVAMTLGRLRDGLAGLGWSVQVVRPEQDSDEFPSAEAAARDDVIVPGLPLPGYKGLRMGEPAIFSMGRAWRARRPDIVHVATEGPLGLAALWVARRLGLPVSSTFHTNFDQYSGHYHIGFIEQLARSYLRWVHNACVCTLAPTRQMADELEAGGYRNVGVLSRGVDTELFDPARRDEALRREWGVGPGGRALLYVGRAAREKNIDLAVGAYRALAADHPEDRMVVVGDGPELERLKAESPRIVYAGMRRGTDLARHYASGDVFLFPSVTETFGNVVTEAMASGLAVVTYDYAAGRQHVIHGENGFLAAFGDGADFEQNAREARALPDDRLAAVRQAARETALGIRWSRVAATFDAALREAIARGPRAG